MIWNCLGVLFGALCIALAVWAVRQRQKLPVRFKSIDEYVTVTDVTNSALKQLPRDDPRRLILQVASLRLDDSVRPVVVPPSWVRISAEDLRVLAPFIDLWIDKKGPPINLPFEYQAEMENERAARLAAFKARMQSEGLWPAA
jgi:hypothetical protein